VWLDVAGTQLHSLLEHAGFIKVTDHLKTKEKTESWRRGYGKGTGGDWLTIGRNESSVNTVTKRRVLL
jgi:hypothetical protein